MRNIRTLALGLLLGVCLAAFIDHARAQNRPVAAQRGRYLVTPTYAGGNHRFFVHDLETDTICYRVFADHGAK